jgi:hypothetical protein
MLFNFFFYWPDFMTFIHLCAGVHVCQQPTRGSQRTSCGHQFFLSTIWIEGQTQVVRLPSEPSCLPLKGTFQYCSFPQMSATENTKLLFRSLRNNLPQKRQRVGAVGRQWLLDQLASRDSASHGPARCVVWVLLTQPA